MAEAQQAVAFRFEVGQDGLTYSVDNDVVAAVALSILRGWKRWAFDWVNKWRTYFPLTRLNLLAACPVALAAFHYGNFKYALLARTFLNEKLGFISSPYRQLVTSGIVYLVCASSTKQLLKGLLKYNGFMYDEPKKISLQTRIWAFGLQFLAIVNPKLMIYQHVLPKLPLPPLDDTVRRYLLSVKPLLTPEEYEKTVQASEDFKATLGWRLQWYLRAKHFITPNYVTDWWETYVYLYGRSPIMINSNYYGLDLVRVTTKRTQTARAANIVSSLLTMRSKIDNQSLQPLTGMGIRPLCSAQYERAFNTTRIPGKEFDVLRHLHTSEHIAVYHKGRWFQVPIAYSQYEVLPPKDLEKFFQRIIDSPAESLPGEEKLAALTSWKRDEWARCREESFLTNPTNKKSLSIIENAAFVLILDDEDASWDDNDPSKGDKYVEQALFGSGYNKWFDKSLTITVFRNGQICVNAEHAWADAPVCCQLFEFTFWNDVKNLGYDEQGHTLGESTNPKLMPVKLQWDFSEQCLNDIESAYKDARLLIEDTDIKLMNFSQFGKGFVKKCRCSPDGFIQLALQLAYYRDIGCFHLTYEASMTRLYLEGRTETVRACTEHTCAFVKAIDSGNHSKEELRDMLKQSCDNHTRLYRDAMAGKGVDRHLFCLYVTAKYLKRDHVFLKKVIEEPWRLSTSQTPQIQMNLVDLTKNPEYSSPGGGFGPVSFDGYGVSYIVSGENAFWFHVSSRNSSLNTDSTRFKARINQALLDMEALFSEN